MSALPYRSSYIVFGADSRSDEGGFASERSITAPQKRGGSCAAISRSSGWSARGRAGPLWGMPGRCTTQRCVSKVAPSLDRVAQRSRVRGSSPFWFAVPQGGVKGRTERDESPYRRPRGGPGHARASTTLKVCAHAAVGGYRPAQRLCGNESMQLGLQSRFCTSRGFWATRQGPRRHELACIVAASTI